MVNIMDPNFLNMNIPGMSPMTSVLLSSTQLAANYELWENNEKIQEIVNMEKNFFCKLLQKTHSYLDEKSIKCIVLALFIHMYKETMNIMTPNC